MAEIAPFVPFDQQLRDKYLKTRPGETKLGEVMAYPEQSRLIDFLQSETIKYVIFGIPEDIGVRANLGVPGTASAWDAFLSYFLNCQSNSHLTGNQIAILGHFNLKHAYLRLEEVHESQREKEARQLTSTLDEAVWRMVSQVVKSGKIPIIIGGGHNNSYGNLRGFSNALGKPINCINLDPHTDLRPLEGRHSGNGFSYALKEGYLKNYLVFGMHEAYKTAEMQERFMKEKHLSYISFEDLMVRRKMQTDQCLDSALAFVCKAPFGVEVDLDAIANMPSSAMSPSGFSIEFARSFVHKMGSHPHAGYLHLCEGAPDLGGKAGRTIVGKALSYLVQDFIKSHQTT
jgi:formiminoglutamase